METRVPPKCPYCSRLTVDNARHCFTDDAEKWAKSCLTIVCKCNAVYRAGAQFRTEGRPR